MSADPPIYLVAGATGVIGRRLCAALLADGIAVRALARDPESARRLLGPGPEIVAVDLEADDAPEILATAMSDVTAAYFLVHMLGTGPGYGEREVAAARVFATAAREAGVERLVYLGGLGADDSPHLLSRHETAMTLARYGPPLTYFRAAMIVAPDSESYVLLESIARRLPALPAPAWLTAKTQPIGIKDVVDYLRLAPTIPEAAGAEVQIGGPEVLTHLDVIDAFSREIASRPALRIPLPDRIAAPDVVAAGAAAVTTGTPEVAAELGLGLTADTKVEDPSGAKLFPIAPEPLNVAIQRALAEQERG